MQILLHISVLAVWLLAPSHIAAFIRWFKRRGTVRYWYRQGDYFILGDEDEEDECEANSGHDLS